MSDNAQEKTDSKIDWSKDCLLLLTFVAFFSSF